MVTTAKTAVKKGGEVMSGGDLVTISRIWKVHWITPYKGNLRSPLEAEFYSLFG